MLTNKQEAFCKAVALEGLNQSDAYREFYRTGNMKPETINNSAYKLMNNGDVKARIKELKDSLTAKVIEGFAKTKDDLLRELEEIKDQTVDIERDKALKERRECIKEQGKLLGYYVDNLNVAGNISFVAGMTAFKNRKKDTNK